VQEQQIAGFSISFSGRLLFGDEADNPVLFVRYFLPLSGYPPVSLVQQLAGALSDSANSRYRLVLGEVPGKSANRVICRASSYSSLFMTCCNSVRSPLRFEFFQLLVESSSTSLTVCGSRGEAETMKRFGSGVPARRKRRCRDQLFLDNQFFVQRDVLPSERIMVITSKTRSSGWAASACEILPSVQRRHRRQLQSASPLLLRLFNSNRGTGAPAE